MRIPTRSFVRRSAALAASSLVLAATRCESPLAPEEVAGTYELRMVRDERLPVVVASDPVERVVTFGEIELAPDGTGEVRHAELMAGEVRSWTLPFTYALPGSGGFFAELTCPPEMACVDPPHLRGDFRGDWLRLLQHGAPGDDWRYERVERAAALETRHERGVGRGHALD